MIEDTWGEKGWRSAWMAMPSCQRRELLAELRRGETVRGPEEALLTLREARRVQQSAPVRALLGVAAVLGTHLLLARALGRAVAGREVVIVLLLGVAGLVWGTLSQRRALDRGIAVNVAALQHWVEHAAMPGLGPPSPEEAKRLLRIIEAEGWTRPHR